MDRVDRGLFPEGQAVFAVAGIASVVPLFAIVGMPMAAIGAIRLAKPGSTWAMSYLGWKQ